MMHPGASPPGPRSLFLLLLPSVSASASVSLSLPLTGIWGAMSQQHVGLWDETSHLLGNYFLRIAGVLTKSQP
ncbi:hypothetical protein LX32DRAFT_635971 [Colletotrichum zoysiae]|uniref:Uncharacterized protein n=1 Tax=Colletotrichum zoysiae TaxID=1216348 RepID=A0AAD9HNZ6_9PEZI|nr:hypothetical protein LX32DRAFT_635971 [Colletotrichum zoysiae]